MRKSEDVCNAGVKNEMVSVSANLEVVSQESFLKRLEGMSSACRCCQRERYRSQRSKQNRKGKINKIAPLSKPNAPLVIHLKDSVLHMEKNKQFNMDGNSDLSAKSTNEDLYASSGSGGSGSVNVGGNRLTQPRRKPNFDYPSTSLYGDVASIPEFVPQSNSYHYHQAWSQNFYHYVPLTFYSMLPLSTIIQKSHILQSTQKMNTEQPQKSLSELLSVIEKPNRLKSATMEANLKSNSSDAKTCTVLNNVSHSLKSDAEIKRKNITDSGNIELICNDLSSNASPPTENSDESDTSDKASVVSNSDDVTGLSVLDENKGKEFTAEELELLAEYTTGVPLIRYDCAVSQCSECINAYNNRQYFHNEGCRMFPGFWSPHIHNSQNYSHSPNTQQQVPDSLIQQSQKLAAHRTSTPSESDSSSDIDAGSTRSSTSSFSSSSSLSSSDITTPSVNSSLSASDSDTPKASSRNPEISNSSKIRGVKPIKRATVSWKNARKCLDNNGSRRAYRSSYFSDSVFLDLTDMDVSIYVTYHTENPTWPYSVHSLYEAIYSPSTMTNTTGTSSPLCFNNPMLYSYYAEMTSHDIRKSVFSVMCYNVLCDKLCTKAMYAYCPTWALSWDYRKTGIMNDILTNSADIITLQEVETEQYQSMFYPELAKQGYDGIFLPKSRVKTMNSDKEKKSVDGCAIFFKKTKFEKVHEYQVEFNQLATKDGIHNTDTDMINRVMTKDNIAIVAVLKTKSGVYDKSPVPPPKGLTQMLMVSTAHIHWDPQSPDVKLVQTMMLIEELQKFVKEASLQFRPNAPPPSMDTDLCNSIPLILCGDFNSLPNSGVYEYISKGRLDANHKDFDGQNYQVFMKDRNDNGSISHNFKLTSAYKEVMPFTNYTFDFKGIIDYIFYSHHHLRLHKVMGLQDEEWFRVNKIVGCPHPFVPSDHFPLFAEFSLPVVPQRPR